MGEGTFDLSQVSDAAKYVDEQHRDNVNTAIEKQEKYQFTFRGSQGQSVGDVVPIHGTTWSLVQIFPSEAARIVLRGTNKDSLRSIGMIVFIFLAFILFLVVFRKRDEKRRSAELAFNKVNSLMRGVAEDYVCLIDVDLVTQKEMRYLLASGDGLADWASEDDDYTNCITMYANAYVAEYDRERFLQDTKLPVLQKVLSQQNDFYIEYDAVINGAVKRFQGKFTISDSKQYENHMLISIRDITESTRERNEKERELSEAKVMAESANRAKKSTVGVGSSFTVSIPHRIADDNVIENMRNNAIIAMTANAFEEDKKNAMEAGMNGHIAKPIEITKLVEILRDFIPGNLK